PSGKDRAEPPSCWDVSCRWRPRPSTLQLPCRRPPGCLLERRAGCASVRDALPVPSRRSPARSASMRWRPASVPSTSSSRLMQHTFHLSLPDFLLTLATTTGNGGGYRSCQKKLEQE